MLVTLRETDPERVPTFYFSQNYGVTNANHTGNQWRNLSDSRGMWQIPLEIRSDIMSYRDAVTPYGYGGIFADDSLTPEDIDKAWENSKELLHREGVVSVFLRFSPFLDFKFSKFSNLKGLQIEHISDTVSVDITNEEDNWAGLKGRARTAVRKAKNLGFQGRIHKVELRDIHANSPFRRLYNSTMKRLNASSDYLFEDSYFLSLLNSDEDNLFIAEVVDSNNITVAAALVLIDTKTAHYHLSGSDPEFARLGTNNLLIWTIIQWAIKQGLMTLHLGGGTKPADSLFRFKDSFGGRHSKFWVGKAIINPDLYNELVEERSQSLAVQASDLLNSGYFPAYRATVPPSHSPTDVF